MKKLIAVLAFFVSLSANANIITVNLSETDVEVGDTVTVSLLADNFDYFDTFDFKFDFDTSIFSYDPTSLLSNVSAGILEVNQVANGMALTFVDFFTAYEGNLLLASFNLTVIGAGTSDFSFSDVYFEDAAFQSVLTVDSSSSASAEANAVSAPATLGLFAIALFALAGFRRKA